jgi:hypothetical protein
MIETLSPDESLPRKTLRDACLVLEHLMVRMSDFLEGPPPARPVPPEIEHHHGILKQAMTLFSKIIKPESLAVRSAHKLIKTLGEVNRFQIDNLTAIRIGANVIDAVVRATSLVPYNPSHIQMYSVAFANLGSILAEKLPEILREPTALPPQVFFQGDPAQNLHHFFFNASVIAGAVEDGRSGAKGTDCLVEIEDERPVKLSLVRNFMSFLSVSLMKNRDFLLRCYEKLAPPECQNREEVCDLSP